EEHSRGSAEHDTKNPCTESANQRRNYDCWGERNERNAHNVRIDDGPQRRGNRGAQECEGVGPDGSRPQRGDINVERSEAWHSQRAFEMALRGTLIKCRRLSKTQRLL